MEHVKVREMIVEDIEEVYDIEKRCFAIPWSKESFFAEIQNNKSARYVVLEIDGKVVGYGGMWKILDEGHITNIAVHPDVRGRGYGNLLVEGLLEVADKEEIKRMTLEVRSSNKVAQNLYKKYGFEPCGIRPKYYQDNNENAVIMWREN
ncbi:ribosomal-protein-alanine N-acetyltransferase [Crassaminicella thermophila]|uniref:[Ribosomal protein bS18]-alanine N-acetyltransferase n=1 Tax=Crassaminicella thermophila TaxID=2599308 RepID=A0A5C0SG33_CRATE|nr:ribosomal protein S18-alanine N-acetyltransferase [Crassaminicella thermophila]QEK13120.1 ribosomal-protein-alanine N-acetyltransferase [Crassaminicella thermophila]